MELGTEVERVGCLGLETTLFGKIGGLLMDVGKVFGDVKELKYVG